MMKYHHHHKQGQLVQPRSAADGPAELAGSRPLRCGPAVYGAGRDAAEEAGKAGL